MEETMYETFPDEERAISAAKAASHERAVTVVRDTETNLFKIVPYSGVALMLRSECPIESFWRGEHPYA
jgi:hypothetical protein